MSATLTVEATPAEPRPPNRRIAAVLAADVAGYSSLVAEDEEETLRRLAIYRAVFTELAQRYGGRLYAATDETVLVEFQSSVVAMRCALDIQESLRARNQAYPGSRQMNFRIGIDAGDVAENEGQLSGDGVLIAARLNGLARPGGICVSRVVHEQAASKLSVRFAGMGPQQVPEVAHPVHAYQVMAVGVPGSAGVPSRLAQEWRVAGLASIALVSIVLIGFTVWRLASGPQVAVAPTRESAPVARQEPTAPQKAREQATEPDAMRPAAPPTAASTTAAGRPHAPTYPPTLPVASPETSPRAELAEPKSSAASPLPTDLLLQPRLPPSAASSSAKSSDQTVPAEPAAAAPRTMSTPPPAMSSPATPPPKTAAAAEKSPADRKRRASRCAEITERAQLGELSDEDRLVLQKECR